MEFVDYSEWGMSDWFGVKREDHEDLPHAVPEGPMHQWDLILEYISDEKDGSFELGDRLSAFITKDIVLLWSTRNAGCMRGPKERDYILVTHEWLKEEVSKCSV